MTGKSDVGTSLIPCDACFAALEIAGIKVLVLSSIIV